jgi:hypothetical protein
MWLERFSWSVLVLEDSGTLWGQAHCLPVTKQVYDAMLRSTTDIRKYLTRDNILTDPAVNTNVAHGVGNYCFVGLSANNPALRREDHGYFAMPLFVGLQELFFRIRLRGLVCQSRTAVEKQTIAGLGCRKKSVLVSANGTRVTLWYFDISCAQKYPLTTLSQTLHCIWSEEPKLKLTKREQEVVRYASAGLLDWQIAAKLAVGEKTVQKHWENIYIRCRSTRGIFVNINRAAVIAYCERHLSELSWPQRNN